jgi:hypothetical protein
LNPCEHASDGTVRVLGLTETVVRDVNEVLALVQEGSFRRKTEVGFSLNLLCALVEITIDLLTAIKPCKHLRLVEFELLSPCILGDEHYVCWEITESSQCLLLYI